MKKINLEVIFLNYYNQQNHIFPEQYNYILRDNKISDIRKTLSGLGFLLFASEIVFTLLGIVEQQIIQLPSLLSVNFFMENFFAIHEFWHGIMLFSSLFIVGCFYCLMSNTKFKEIIMFNKVKPTKLIGLIFFGLGIAYVGNVLTSLLLGNMSTIGIENSGGSSDLETNILTFIVSTFITSVTPAFAEEFLFRGVILGKLRKYGDGFALLISSLMFALMHCNIGQIPFAFIGGIVFGFATIKTNSMLPAILIHGFNNLISCFMGEIGLIENEFLSMLLPNIIFAIMFLLGIIGFLILIKSDMLLFKFENNFKNIHFNFSMKELITYFFTNFGMIFAITIFTLETLSNTNLTWFT